MIAAARAHFELPPDDERLTVIEADGALYVRQHPGSADIILLDGFDAGNQVEALATQTFYAACRRALRPGGVLVVNLWGRDTEFAEYFARLTRAFDGEVGWISVQHKTNVIVFAFGESGAAARLEQCDRSWPICPNATAWICAGFARDLQWSDDDCPFARLTDLPSVRVHRVLSGYGPCCDRDSMRKPCCFCAEICMGLRGFICTDCVMRNQIAENHCRMSKLFPRLSAKKHNQNKA